MAAVFEDDCTLTDSGVRNVIAALQGLRDVPWDIFRLGRKTVFGVDMTKASESERKRRLLLNKRVEDKRLCSC